MSREDTQIRMSAGQAGHKARRRVMLAFFVITIGSVAAASIVPMDIVTTAPGRLIVPGYTKSIVSPLPGQVTSVYVKDGQQVAKDALLVQFDVSQIKADLYQAKNEFDLLSKKIARYQSLVECLRGHPLNIPDIRLKCVTAVDDQVGQSIINTLQTGIELNEKKIKDARRRKSIEYVRYEKLTELVVNQEGLLKRLHRLVAEGFYAEAALVPESIKLKQYEVEREESRAQILASDQDITDGSLRQRQHLDDFVSNTLQQLEAFRKDASTVHDLIAALTFKLNSASVKAPVGGTVEDMKLTTVPTTVSPSETLMRIVPNSTVLLVEGTIPESSIGKAAVGMRCRLKVDAFPYTRFGTIPCKIASIGRDRSAVNPEGFIFRANIDMNSLSQSKLRLQLEALRAGMGAQVDIVVGRRTLMSYFTDPILAAKNEALNER